MFEKLLKVVTKSAPGNDNDFADRLNYRYTAAVYMLMSMAVIGRSYIADPIKCWTPNYFPESWVDYTNNLCFVQSTYYIPMDVPLGADEAATIKRDNEITYYQWIPLFFMMLAMCFYVPRAVWFNVFSHHFVDVNAIVDLLTSFDNAVNPETRDPAVMQVAKHIDRYLLSATEYRKHPIFRLRSNLAKKKIFLFYCGRRYGLSITTIYLQLKLCYIIIGVLQIYWIDTFLMGATESSIIGYYQHIFTESYAIKVLVSLAHDNSSLELSPKFPRITMCEFEVRSVGELLTYNVQCVLPLNLFNEKIFLFLWMWIMFVLIMTCTNMIAWLWRLGISWNRDHYIMKHLRLMGKLSEDQMRHHKKITKKLMRYFIHQYLRPDGVFLMRLIAINTNCLISSEIISSLWENFLDHPFIAERAEKYHDQMKDLGLLTEEDDNRVLASLKKMNLKASKSSLASEEHDILPPLRVQNENFSIFEPLLLSSKLKKKVEKENAADNENKSTAPGKEQTAASKRFQAKFGGKRDSLAEKNEPQPEFKIIRGMAFSNLDDEMASQDYEGMRIKGQQRRGRGTGDRGRDREEREKSSAQKYKDRLKSFASFPSRARFGFSRSLSCENEPSSGGSNGDFVDKKTNDFYRPAQPSSSYALQSTILANSDQEPRAPRLSAYQREDDDDRDTNSPQDFNDVPLPRRPIIRSVAFGGSERATSGFFPRPIIMGPLQGLRDTTMVSVDPPGGHALASSPTGTNRGPNGNRNDVAPPPYSTFVEVKIHQPDKED